MNSALAGGGMLPASLRGHQLAVALDLSGSGLFCWEWKAKQYQLGKKFQK